MCRCCYRLPPCERLTVSRCFCDGQTRRRFGSEQTTSVGAIQDTFEVDKTVGSLHPMMVSKCLLSGSIEV
ncbi:hypothetical protein ScPMuIL_018337 [Solemya velum]